MLVERQVIFGLSTYIACIKYHALEMCACTRTMASKKFITWGFLFILMFLLASEAASRKVLETFELGNSSNSAFILGFYF